MTITFNRTLAKTAAADSNFTGSMGRTSTRWTLSTGEILDTSVGSNYEYSQPLEGDWRFNRRILKNAPVGTTLKNIWDYNWAGSEPEHRVSTWTKLQSGAWMLNA